MTHALIQTGFAPTSTAHKGGRLGLVIGLHLALLIAVLSGKSPIPTVAEIPMTVDLLTAPSERKSIEPTPQAPAVRPTPPRPAAAPKLAAPSVETTTSQLAAPAAPVAAPAEAKTIAPAAAPAPAVESTTQARFDADTLRNPAPPYPPMAKRQGEEGKVVLRVSVTPQGMADSVEIRTSSGSSRLDDSAQRTVRNWRFIPARRGDMPVQSWVLVPIIFKLEQ